MDRVALPLVAAPFLPLPLPAAAAAAAFLACSFSSDASLILLQGALHIELVLELLESVGELGLTFKLGHLLEALAIGLVLDEASGIERFHVELFNIFIKIVIVIVLFVILFGIANGLLLFFVFRRFLHIVICRSWLAQLLATATTSWSRGCSRSSRSVVNIHGIVVTVVTAIAVGHGRHTKLLASAAIELLAEALSAVLRNGRIVIRRIIRIIAVLSRPLQGQNVLPTAAAAASAELLAERLAAADNGPLNDGQVVVVVAAVAAVRILAGTSSSSGRRALLHGGELATAAVDGHLLRLERSLLVGRVVTGLLNRNKTKRARSTKQHVMCRVMLDLKNRKSHQSKTMSMHMQSIRYRPRASGRSC